MPNPSAKSLTAQIATLTTRVAVAERIAEGEREAAVAARNDAVRADKSLAEAKVIIAYLREQLAEVKGYVRRVNEQDDAGSELIPEPKPLVQVPRTKVARNGRAITLGADYGDRWGDAAERERPKHWPAL